MEDDCVCEYDSTWDTESDGDDPAGESQTRRSCQDKNKSGWNLVNWHHTSRNIRAAKDMQNYRRGYPNLTDDECSEDKMNNLQFYLNKFPSAPDDVYIESFLKEWKNDYKRLERVHSYIQWLFPLREPGVNYMASELSKKEIEAFKQNVDAKKRLVESYELMLGFYGMRLVNKETGEVKRADNWKERFGNLERNMHNNLRITRILKSLGELGFEHYQAPLVHFFLEETLVKKTLSSVKRSVLDYFLFAVLDKQKRQELVRFAYLHFEPKDKFVWCPRKVQKQFRKAEKRANAVGNGDVKDEAYLRSKSKDGETVVQQKEDGTDNIVKTQKGSDKTASKDKNKLSEASPEPKAAAESVGDGNEEAEPDNILGNGKDSADDVDEMDQSASPDSVTSKSEPCADDDLKDTMQDPDNIMQTDEDIDTQKPQQKKGSDKTACKEKNKLSEASPEPKPAAETVGNGNAEAESDNDILGNGKDSADDVDEMDQSASPDSVTSKTEPCAGGEDAMQEPDNIMQTDEDIDTQKPPKKKREDSKVQQSNGSAGDSPCGQVDEKAGGHKTVCPTSPSAQTAPKTSKHSPSLSSGREEKIPRTDFNQVPDKQEEEETS